MLITLLINGLFRWRIGSLILPLICFIMFLVAAPFLDRDQQSAKVDLASSLLSRLITHSAMIGPGIGHMVSNGGTDDKEYPTMHYVGVSSHTQSILAYIFLGIPV